MEFVVRTAVRGTWGHALSLRRLLLVLSPLLIHALAPSRERVAAPSGARGAAHLTAPLPLVKPEFGRWSRCSHSETPSTAASSEESAQTHRARRSASVYLVVSRRIRERACPPERWWVERGGDAPSGRCNRPPATPTRRGPDTTTSYIIEMPPRKRPAEPTRARIRRSAPASRASPRASSPTR